MRAPRGRRGPRGPVWLLDLDNTLHDAITHVMPRINRDMTRFLMRELQVPEDQAAALRVQWWHRYGATLLGLAALHPQVCTTRFLRESHDFPDMPALVRRDAPLFEALRRLPGRRVLFTNAPRHYADAVVQALGIGPLLHASIAIEDMRHAGRWEPKPSARGLRRALARLRVPAARCALVEDTVENLRTARRVGLRTVLVSGFLWGRHRAWRPRAGRGRAIDLQLTTATALPRAAARLFP